MKRAFLAMGLTGLCAMSAGAVPQVLNFQGRLSESGAPVNGPREVTFRIFNEPAGGAAQFTEVHAGTNAVVVSTGIFNAVIGELTSGGIPLAVFDGEPKFVEVEVAGAVLPRQRMTSVGYAFRSEYAAQAGSLASGATIQFTVVNVTSMTVAVFQATSAVVSDVLKVGKNTIILGETPQTGGAPNTIAFTGGDAFIKTQDPGAGGLFLQTGSTQNILLSPGGNVGVGITNPSSVLSFRMGTGSGQAAAIGVAHANAVPNTVVGPCPETTLMAYTLPANSLNKPGQRIKATAFGSGIINFDQFSSPYGVVRLHFGGTYVCSMGVFPELPWIMEVMVMRMPSGVQKIFAGTPLGELYFEDGDCWASTASEDLSTDIQIRFTVELGDGFGSSSSLSFTGEALAVDYFN